MRYLSAFGQAQESPQDIEKFYIQPIIQQIAGFNNDISRIISLGTSATADNFQMLIDRAISLTSLLETTYQNYPDVMMEERYQMLRQLILGFKENIIDLAQRGLNQTVWDTAIGFWNQQLQNILNSNLVQSAIKDYRESIKKLNEYEKRLPELPPDKREEAQRYITLAKATRVGIQTATLGQIDELAGTTGLSGFGISPLLVEGLIILGTLMAIAGIVLIVGHYLKPIFEGAGELLKKIASAMPKLLDFPAVVIPAIVLISIFALPKIVPYLKRGAKESPKLIT